MVFFMARATSEHWHAMRTVPALLELLGRRVMSDLAVIKIECDPSLSAQFKTIENLRLTGRPSRVAGTDRLSFDAVADEAAQEQLRALGCAVTIVKTPEEYGQDVCRAFDVICDTPMKFDGSD
jgi:hypothetical protein